MPTQKVTFRPGINKQLTPTLNEGGWSDGNLIRFVDGLPQPIGGWVSTIATPMLGVPRKLHSWANLNAAPIWAAGTTQRLYGGGGATTLPYPVSDITPFYTTISGTTALHTTAGSSAVTITTPFLVPRVSDRVNLTSTSIGGLSLGGDYTIVGQVGSVYTITAAGNASSTSSTCSPSTTVGFYLQAGAVDAVAPRDPMLWSLDHWGQDLIACFRDGPIFVASGSGGLPGTATLLSPSTAPATAKCVLVGMPERHLIAFGTSTSGAYAFGTSVADPLLIRWCDVEDYTIWTATATNSAGSFRIVGGTQIMAAAAAPQEILVWTDTTLWSMRFEGLPFVYGFFQQGAACGAISPQSMTVLNGVAYWMGRAGFFRYAGRVEPIECTVWDAVFRNLNASQQMKVHCGTNMGFSEVWWFYPSAGSSEIDSYVKVNVANGAWDTGTLSRTAWEDALTFQTPLATDAAGNLFAHETGATADGSLLPAFVESGFADLGDGGDMMFLDKIEPDFAALSGTVNMTVKGRNYATGAERPKGPYAVTSATKFFTPRLRAKQMLLRLASATVGAFWRLGAIRARSAPDGRKA
jgi:hypothetical protein